MARVGETMKDWQVELMTERDRLGIRVKAFYNTLIVNDSLDELCNWVDQMYHMTRYIRALDKEIARWDK